MIIATYQDYYDINESIQVINENWLGAAWKWVFGKYKKSKYKEKIDNLIGPEILDQAIDDKTGEISSKFLDIKKLSDPNTNIEDIFNSIYKKVRTGKYFLTSLKKIQEFIGKEDGAFIADITKKVADGEDEEQPLKSVNDNANEILKKRYEQYNRQFNNFFKHIEQSTIQEKNALLQQIKSEKKENVKMLSNVLNMRFNNAKTILLALQYEIFKKRWRLSDIQDLESGMVEGYKQALKFKKELALEATKAKDEVTQNATNEVKDYITNKYEIDQNVKIKSAKGNYTTVKIKDFKDNGVELEYTNTKGDTKYKIIGYEAFKKYAKPDNGNDVF